MPWVAGVDGCRAGWIVVLVEYHTPALTAIDLRLCRRFKEILILPQAPRVIAIDIPIGLLAQPRPGGRECDRQARRLLGRRASSIFSPPSRRILHATQYDHVRGYGMSRQAFGIMPKIREVDRVMTPALQHVVYEAHPELAFLALAGAPMQCNKKTLAGRAERLRALASAAEKPLQQAEDVLSAARQAFKRLQVAPDDVLDAYVLARTAYRIVQTQAQCLPVDPLVDQRGLRMEIWF